MSDWPESSPYTVCLRETRMGRANPFGQDGKQYCQCSAGIDRRRGCQNRVHRAEQRRDELVNGEIFYSLAEARAVIGSRCHHYNTTRPHSSLGYRPVDFSPKRNMLMRRRF